MRSLLSLALVLAATVGSLGPACPRAAAQGAYPILGRPSANRFYRAPGRFYMMVDDAETPGDLAPSVDVTFDYSHRPLAIDDVPYYTEGRPMTGQELDLVSGTATLQLTGAIAIANRIQIGINVPIILSTGGNGYSWTEMTAGGPTRLQNIPGGSASTLGDPRLHVRLRPF